MRGGDANEAAYVCLPSRATRSNSHAATPSDRHTVTPSDEDSRAATNNAASIPRVIKIALVGLDPTTFGL